MMITATPSFMEHYIRPQQERLRPRRPMTSRPDSVALRVHFGRGLIALGALLSGERIEPAARRPSSARTA